MNGKVGWIGAGALVAVVAVAASVVLIRRATDEPTPQPAVCRFVQPQGAGAPAANTGLIIAEQGWSVIPGGKPRLSIGVVVQNTSTQVAYGTRVTFNGADDSATAEVPLLAPGEKAAVGRTIAGSELEPGEPVTLAVSEWLPPGDTSNGLAPVTARVVRESVTRTEDAAGTFFFVSRNENCGGLVSLGIGFVWRDASGAVVGGDVDERSQTGICRAGGSGRPLSARTEPQSVPAAADLTKLEATPLCAVRRR